MTAESEPPSFDEDSPSANEQPSGWGADPASQDGSQEPPLPGEEEQVVSGDSPSYDDPNLEFQVPDVDDTSRVTDGDSRSVQQPAAESQADSQPEASQSTSQEPSFFGDDGSSESKDEVADDRAVLSKDRDTDIFVEKERYKDVLLSVADTEKNLQ
ncbi:hypothetical protein KY327_03310, partial [Candidatus Woesearchaeota archaeon]|nr:hypothetical protein [Candidatus Woesearchaeota archaeon]